MPDFSILHAVVTYLPLIIFLFVAWVVISVVSALFMRVVVPTNSVHIVQSRKKTVSYGKDQPAGNTYYRWPAWVPRIGIRVIVLPVSVFDLHLNEYSAYDKGRVPFEVDILAFFRVDDPNTAAQRVSSFEELRSQLTGILQGASRSILAQNPIEEILEKRAEYGHMFTEATNDQLKAWGVVNVKSIELMDLRDTEGSNVIKNIMAVKSSAIAMDSRIAVANNNQKAQEAEIAAGREVEIRKQEALEQVGIRTATKNQQIGIAEQKANQAVKDEEKVTAEKTMAIANVNQVRTAEIARDVATTEAEQHKRVMIISAEGEKQQAITQAEGEKQKTITHAEGVLEANKLEAEGTRAKGIAQGDADQAVQMVPINVQIALAKEIGQNDGYQRYLVSIKQIEAGQAVGVEQAKALEQADIKVIANAGNVVDGVTTAMDLFSAKGGVQLGAMLEGLKNTDAGKAVINALTGQKSAPNGAGR